MKKHSLDQNTANGILQNVFEECNVTPNEVPFDKIMLRSIAETKGVRFFKYFAVAILILVIASPLAFKQSNNFGLVNSARSVSIENHALYEHYFILTLSGTAIDYNAIYAKKADGAYIYPDSIDKKAGLVIFPYDGDSLNIYITSLNGEVIHAVLAENK